MIRISRGALRTAGLLLLALPSCAFLLTWVRPAVGVPCVLALVAAWSLFARRERTRRMEDAFGDRDEAFSLSRLSLALIIACAVLFTFFSGIGGLFYQNEDHYGRNAILHDLLENSWPVYFEGTSYALTYYIAYWLLPALFAKAASLFLGSGVLWSAANAALFAQTVVFLTVIFLLFVSLVRARSALSVCVSLLAFVLFSGMDALALPFYPDWWNSQLEWWGEVYQFSSHTTCLFWVYNQAVPAWLAILLLMTRPKDFSSYALIGLCAFPFSPFPFVGLFFCMMLMAVWALVRCARTQHAGRSAATLLRACLSPENLLACAAILPCFGPYFMANQASGDSPLHAELFIYAFGVRDALLRLVRFELIEFGALALALSRRYRRDPLFVIAMLSLVLSPIFRMGYKADFSMRASIPGLTLLCVYAVRFLLESFSRRQSLPAAAVVALILLIGSVTPLTEFARGVYKVKTAGTIFLTSDPYQTVLHEEADTFNFICEDVNEAFFYRHLARKGAHHS